MTIGDMREWLKALPSSFDDMQLVFRKYDGLGTKVPGEEVKEGDEAGDYYVAIDAPIVSGYIDEDTRECCFLDGASREFIIKMNQQADEAEDLEKKE